MDVDEKIGYVSYGHPARGCKLCIKGEKLVLFITGLCGQKCFYCPISEKKFGVDVIYANEWNIKNKEELLEEVDLTDANGAGITGGDPLVTLNKTCEFIELLKEKKGKDFHIHLYTPLKLVTKDSLKKLYQAGLDEIRFHPILDSDKEWSRINLAKVHDWSIGVEIPCVPDKEKEIKKLIDYIEELNLEFINLNELEVSDTEVSHYNLESYKTKNPQTYAVEGSRELAEKLIKYAQEKNYSLTVYFCSAKLKDKTQMGNRILRRAKKVARRTDKITSEGMLLRGVVYIPEIAPGSSYQKRLKQADKKTITSRLELTKQLLEKKLNLRNSFIDEDKLRLLMSLKEVKRLAKKIKKLGFIPAMVEEYPTKDAVEVELNLL